MTKPWDLESVNEIRLLQKGFIQTVGGGIGMRQAYEWINNSFKVGLYYDRGYFDCYLTPNKEPIRSFSLIWLLKYLYNDPSFYDDRLKKANLLNTLTSNEYINLLLNHYYQIENFFASYSLDSYDKWNRFMGEK